LLLDFGTVPAGSFVREKSRLRLYSASGALLLDRREVEVLRFAVLVFAVLVFAVLVFAVLVFGTLFFRVLFFVALARVPSLPAALLPAELFLADVVLAVFFAVFFFATGRFTVRLRVVAMRAPWCEECADRLSNPPAAGSSHRSPSG
jgi:hypothetical protein